jgi:hypothetical protein
MQNYKIIHDFCRKNWAEQLLSLSKAMSHSSSAFYLPTTFYHIGLWFLKETNYCKLKASDRFYNGSNPGQEQKIIIKAIK